MFGKKKEKPVQEEIKEDIKEQKEAVSEEKPAEEKKQEPVKEQSDGMKALNALLANNVSIILSFFLMILLIVAGVKLQQMSDSVQKQATVNLSQANNRLSSANQTLSDLQNQIAINKHEGGIDELRHQSDDGMFVEWIKDAFTFVGYDEYMEHRQKYLDALGYSDPFVREFMPSVEANTELASQMDYLNAQLNCQMSSISTYVVSIDEETGTYSYIAVVSISSQNSRGATASVTGDVTLMYDTVVGEDGTVSIDFDSFKAYSPSVLWR